MPWFCCGVIVRSDNVVVEAAPILAWAVGKPFAAVRDWLRAKGGGYEVVGGVA